MGKEKREEKMGANVISVIEKQNAETIDAYINGRFEEAFDKAVVAAETYAKAFPDNPFNLSLAFNVMLAMSKVDYDPALLLEFSNRVELLASTSDDEDIRTRTAAVQKECKERLEKKPR